MPDLARILKTEYGVISTDIRPPDGRIIGLGYRVHTTERDYFLKVYVKSKKATAQWTALIDQYIPILIWLNQNTDLKGWIVQPVLTISGAYKCEDENAFYLMFSYISGYTVGEASLTTPQATELAHIVGILHQQNAETIPGCYGQMTEDFGLPFCSEMISFMENRLEDCVGEVKSILTHYRAELLDAASKALQASNTLSTHKPAFVFCHTDIHNYNIMQADRLFLIDWEGLKTRAPGA